MQELAKQLFPNLGNEVAIPQDKDEMKVLLVANIAPLPVEGDAVPEAGVFEIVQFIHEILTDENLWDFVWAILNMFGFTKTPQQAEASLVTIIQLAKILYDIFSYLKNK